MSLADLLNLPGVTARPAAETRDYVYNHTMIRVKDLQKSMDFYTRVLGFVPVHRSDFPDAEVTIYYLVRQPLESIPAHDDDKARQQWVLGQSGVLELTYNYGTEKQADFHYHSGNSDPRGFGHLCISVPDVQAACARFEELGVDFQKRLSDGRMRHIAFIKDPDGYWIEILQPTPLA